MGTPDKEEFKRRGPGGVRASQKNAVPWARQSGEPLEAFQWFTVYRDMPQRSILETARISGKSSKCLHRYATEYQWQIRAIAWDNEIERRMQNAEVSKLVEMKNRQIQLGIGMQTIAGKELLALQNIIKRQEERAKVTNTSRPPYLSARDIKLFVEAGAALERLNRGQADSIVEIKAPSDGLDLLSKEDLRTYRELLLKMQGNGDS